MKLKTTLKCENSFVILLTALCAITFQHASAQISTVCTDPDNIIYGLTGNGEIREINVNTAATGTVVKNNSYTGNSPSKANGMGYNYVDGKFYYFKRNVGSSPNEFVSFHPATGTVTMLATTTCAAEVHTGCVSSSGTGYYTIDTDGNLNYYNITTNSWTFITSTIVDQNGNDVDAVVRSQNAGDMSIDGWGNIWLVTSSNSNYGLYRFPANLPTTPVASFTVTRVIDPSSTTPTGQSFAGIAFNPTGQIYMATKNGNRLYRLENTLSLTFVGTLGTSDLGNDLTSCSFPYKILPVLWKEFSATLAKNNQITLSWEVYEQNNQGYFVEQSLDGLSWNSLGFVSAENNPNDLSEYSFTTMGTSSGNIYFRLRTTDKTGRNGYSDVRMLTMPKSNNQLIAVWPNPARENIQVSNLAEEGTPFQKARLFDLNGQILIEKQLQPGLNTISLSTLKTGTYVLSMVATNGTIQTQKIIKQ